MLFWFLFETGLRMEHLLSHCCVAIKKSVLCLFLAVFFFFKRILFCFCFLTGVIGTDVRGHGLACEGQPVTSRLAVICGTSSCHMGVSLPGQG